VNETPIVLERIFSRARWSRPIIASTSFLFLLILLPVSAQRPSPRIDPRIFTTVPTPTPTISPGNPTVSLKADKETVQIGESVKFTATLNPPRREVIYGFETDGRGIGGGMDQTEAVAQFSTPGPHVVSVRAFIRGTTLTARTKIQVNERPRVLRVQLTPDKPQARVGEAVTFTISTIPDLPNLDYEFDPGDGSPTHHGKTPKIKHTYTDARNYTAMVSLRGAESPARADLTISQNQPPPPPYSPSGPVATAVTTVAPSIAQPPTATSTIPPPPPFPWIYVIPAALLVVIIGYLLHRKPKPKPMAARPTFHPHWNRGEPQKQQENVTINYEVHFDPNISKGRQRLETDGASLIISRKKKQ
jgi:hypothetical protein